MWFALSAVMVAVVVAGFYVYSRLAARALVHEVPKKLGLEVQQTSEGFQLSKSEQGRTLFTVRASKAIQYKEGGRAELKDVKIVIYGKSSDRFDQIEGADFEYDPSTGDIHAKGDVHIDLQANSQGPKRPDQAPPEELKNPVHLHTSGLVFNQKTGDAHTDERVEFRLPQASGTSVGAIYNSHTNNITLTADVHLVTNDGAKIDAAHAEMTKEPHQAVLTHATVARPTGTLSGDVMTLYLRPDNTVDRVLVAGNYETDTTGASPAKIRAAQGDFAVDPKNRIRSGVLSGGVSLDAAGSQPLQATAGKALLEFDNNSRISKVHAVENVKLVQQPNPQRSNSQGMELTAEGLDVDIREGRALHYAETRGAAQVVLLPQEKPAAKSSSANSRTVITAARFDANFDDQGKFSRIHGAPDAKVVSTTPGLPDKISTSDRLVADLAPGGGISTVIQEGNFHYIEGTRTAVAQKAVYTTSDEMIVLTGSPRVSDSGTATTAQIIRMSRATGEAFGDRDVKTTYSELKPQPNGGMLASSDPIHVTAKSMTAQRATATAHYSGGARLWQGANVVEAPTIDFDRTNRTVVATGTPANAVSTVFVQQAKTGKVTLVTVTSSKLTYTDNDRKAHYDGRVIMKDADGTLTADVGDIFLKPKDAGAAAKKAGMTPSQLDHAVAQGDVVVVQPSRRAKGEKLVYTAEDSKFVLTGGPPSIFDAERGTVTGDSLTFYSHDDRVLVESSSNSPTITQTRVIK